jgi:cell division septum initiation protein DivIVA
MVLDSFEQISEEIEKLKLENESLKNRIEVLENVQPSN